MLTATHIKKVSEQGLVPDGFVEPARPVMKAYKVVRHGGRRTDDWRTLWEGDDREKADAIYHKHWVAFRNGSVALVDNATGKAIKQDGAGCWRTRPC